MNLQDFSGLFRGLVFRVSRMLLGAFRGGRISAFGIGEGKIGMVLVINLDRQPQRLKRTLRELSRFRTSNNAPLTSITRRLSAVDARDGRAIAATVDVDPSYRLGDQLYVQPDARLEECFDTDEKLRMTRQEVAVAKSHIEAWKTIAEGQHDHVLVLEDDIWFTRGAASAIDEGWNAAAIRCANRGGPHLLYLSYADAGGTAQRADVCQALFRPIRGLWFLSGYVLSRQGASTLLRSMPVVGPVDMWINRRFEDLGALALSSPAIKQRPDGGSDNSYSILPYLARAGIVDANAVEVPNRVAAGPVIAWTDRGDQEGLAMALSMLGFRVRVFDGDEEVVQEGDLMVLLERFDALVDAPLSKDACRAAINDKDVKFVLEPNATIHYGLELNSLPRFRTAILQQAIPNAASWHPLCTLLGLTPPIHAFPTGAPREFRVFRDDRFRPSKKDSNHWPKSSLLDDSPWALLPEGGWPAPLSVEQTFLPQEACISRCAMTAASPLFRGGVETFPGNMAGFDQEGIVYTNDGAHLVLSKVAARNRPYRSGSFASVSSFGHGRFEAEIKAARGSGIVTGFFLYRDSPRQEIDIELTGDDPHSMMVNVYFNPGDEGVPLTFGYRGSPCRIELGFDSTQDYHLYAIEWRSGCIMWSVDGKVVHKRVGWDPTPLPHLPMRLNANLWVPRSEELAGRLDESALPAMASFRNVSIWS